MKRLLPCVLFLLGNEILSYLALIILVVIFICSIASAAERRS